MAASYIQSKGSSTFPSGTQITLAFTNNVASGSALCAQILWATTATLNKVTDTKNNTWVIISTIGTNPKSAIAYCLNAFSGATTVQFNFSADIASNEVEIVIMEAGGVAIKNALDGSALQSQSNPLTGANAVTSGNLSATPANNGDFIFAGSLVSLNGTWTAGTNFTIGTSANNYACEYYIQPTFAAVAGTFTHSAGNSTFYNGAFALKAAIPSNKDIIKSLRPRIFAPGLAR